MSDPPINGGEPILFMPRQLKLLVELPEGFPLDSHLVAEYLQGNEVLHENGVMQGAGVDLERVLIFPARPATGRPFSLTFIDLPQSFPDLEHELLGLTEHINRQLRSSKTRNKHSPQLLAVSPNWFLTATPQIGTGGPGAWPLLGQSLNNLSPSNPSVPRKPAGYWRNLPVHDATVPYGFKLRAKAGGQPAAGSRGATSLEEHLPQSLRALANHTSAQPDHGHGAGVDVVILDTAPSDSDIAAARQSFGADHPLLQSLLDSQPGVALPTRPYNAEFRRLDSAIATSGLVIEGHSYDMSSHGLFIAGIIHTIAPAARLRLIEVLNRHGITHEEIIARALHDLVKQRGDNPTLVNCSFMLTIPLTLPGGGHYNPYDMERFNIKNRRGWLAFIRRMVWGLRWLCETLAHCDIHIVAAAGNDGGTEDKRAAAPGGPPPARYPAAFPSVLGVGALSEGRTRARYSNLADTPASAGVSTFGGDSALIPSGSRGTGNQDQQTRISIERKGVYGIFIGRLPDPNSPNNTIANDSGWAWWSGTSFAAPIISGSLAVLRGLGMSFDDAEQSLANLSGATSPNAGERLLEIRQNI